MLSLLPDFADPARLCGLGKVYKGAVPLADLPRLAALLMSDDGTADFVLAFDRDEERHNTVRVEVRAALPIQCQRCLDIMMQEVDSVSLLAVVSGPEEAERLPDDLDPLLVDEDRLALRSLIEDELILAIPNAPMHDVDECGIDLGEINSELNPHEIESRADGDENPFAALAQLKSDSESHD